MASVSDDFSYIQEDNHNNSSGDSDIKATRKYKPITFPVGEDDKSMHQNN